jgi:hypothetical protein
MFLFSKMIRPALGLTQHYSLFGGYPGTSLRVKQVVLEADHSPLSSAEVKNEWSSTSTAPYVFILCTGTALLYELDIFVIYDILNMNLKH